jgi:DNA-binding HxlR family transcriptional regulator
MIGISDDIAKLSSMAAKRTYGDRCGISRALDVVGERWALLVVRELLLGPKRFSDLRGGLPHVSADVLAQRLRELEQSGVVRRRKLPPPASARVYELTDWGAELEPVVLGLGRWGSRSPFPPDADVFGPDSAMLALKTLFAPSRADGLDARYELRLGEHTFAARVSGGALQLARSDAVERPAAVLTTTPGALAAVLWHGRPLAAAEAAGEATIEGDRTALGRFLDLFPLPEPA